MPGGTSVKLKPTPGFNRKIKQKTLIMCRIGVFRVPQIQKFVAGLRKSVYFTVE